MVMGKNLKKHVFHVRNMVCSCCITLLKERLGSFGVNVTDINLGSVSIEYDPEKFVLKDIELFLEENHFELAKTREEKIIESIKQAVIELIHHMNNMDSIVRKSDYLVEKLGMNYQQISKIFSHHQPYTLEKFIILHKIERIKELIDRAEFTLGEIAYMMDYSSVQHLSTQFRQITGITVSEYKEGNSGSKIPLDKL